MLLLAATTSFPVLKIIIVKKTKFFYYVFAYGRTLLPAIAYKQILKSKKKHLSKEELQMVNDRVNYYNKMDGKAYDPSLLPHTLRTLTKPKRPKAYYIDIYRHAWHFPAALRANFLYGDINYTPDIPSIQKSRPIHGDNSNAVLLKLDRRRHFTFVKDNTPFREKKDMLIGRGAFRQDNRIRFMHLYFYHPLCDLGQINDDTGEKEWVKPKIAISAHFDYKFILCLEGYDVASNLKWVMNSNSIAVMPEPKFETWFMEGLLIPDLHYIKIKDDFSDLEDRLQYFINNPQECEKILQHANDYVKPFVKDKHEKLVSLLILQKYFEETGQL